MTHRITEMVPVFGIGSYDEAVAFYVEDSISNGSGERPRVVLLEAQLLSRTPTFAPSAAPHTQRPKST